MENTKEKILKILSAVHSAEAALEITSHFADLIDKEKHFFTENLLNLLQINSVSRTFCQKKQLRNERETCEKSLLQEFSISDWDNILSWFLPKLCCIQEIEIMVRDAGLQHISSVGCGSGLLEWIIKGVTGLEVIGYEVNEEWWKTPYAPPKFISHIYADSMEKITPLQSHHALLFSYFNHGNSFRNYMEKYKGNAVIIIGPLDGNRTTDPSPMELLNCSNWTLCRAHVQGNNDIICYYRRRRTTV